MVDQEPTRRHRHATASEVLDTRTSGDGIGIEELLDSAQLAKSFDTGTATGTACDTNSITADSGVSADVGTTQRQLQRHVSRTLPRSACESASKWNSERRNESVNRSLTLDHHNVLDRPATKKRLRRAPSLRSVGGFVQRLVRQLSNASFHSTSKHRSFVKLDNQRATPATTLNKPLLRGGGEVTVARHGVIGLRNHGNTCFMNAVLQCLSHTQLLVEYFVSDQYKNDICRSGNSGKNTRKYGTKGELTEHLAILLKSLWTCRYTADISSDFKSVVGKYGNQYRGYTQHDAQEFLLWLLDKIHEDLKIASEKKSRQNKTAGDAAAPKAAAVGSSFVSELFQALCHSSLTCPGCQRQSDTFDPFLSVSLPIPPAARTPRDRRAVYVTVVYVDARPRQVRIALALHRGGSVAELRRMLAADTRIPAHRLLLTEIYYDGFHRTFEDGTPLSAIRETDNVYAIELPPPLVGATQDGATGAKYLTLVVLNRQNLASQARRFGGPFVLQVNVEISFLELQADILRNMAAMLRDGMLTQEMGVLLRLRVVGGLADVCYLPTDVDHPLLIPTVDRALASCVAEGGIQHLKLLVEWEQATKQCMVANSDDTIVEHASVQQVKQAVQQPAPCTLDECFRLYTQEEMLDAEDAWYCPNCRGGQQGTVKRLSLWSLPDILVIHIKRFKQVGVHRTKLNTLITFPIVGLDMSPLVSRPGAQRPAHSSPSQSRGCVPTCADDYIYDLYAVCNHYGNMQSGHYTAFCWNSGDSQWYGFDDTKVTPLTTDAHVVSRAAYLLFYQRRPASIHHPAPPRRPGAGAATLDTRSSDRLDTRSQDQLDTRSHDRLDTRSHDRLGTRSQDQLDTRSQDQLDTRSHDQLDTRSQDQLDTRSQDQLDTRSHDQLDTRSQDQLDTRSQDQLDTRSQDQLDTRLHGRLDTRSQDQLDTRSQDHLNTRSQDRLDKINEHARRFDSGITRSVQLYATLRQPTRHAAPPGAGAGTTRTTSTACTPPHDGQPDGAVSPAPADSADTRAADTRAADTALTAAAVGTTTGDTVSTGSQTDGRTDTASLNDDGASGASRQHRNICLMQESCV